MVVEKEVVVKKDVSVKQIEKAMKGWHVKKSKEEALLLDLFLVRQKQQAMGVSTIREQWRLATNAVLEDGLKQLEEERQDWAEVLRLRFIDKESVAAVRHKMAISEATAARYRRSGLERLTDIIIQQEATARREWQSHLFSSMEEPTYTQLFGVDETLANLQTWVQSPDAPWVTAVVGLGGIGKTAVADYVARRMIEQFYFDNVVWLRTEDGRFTSVSSAEMLYENLLADLANWYWPEDGPMANEREKVLRLTLQNRPHLIVIDNLEEAADTILLLNRLQTLANPTKFIVTTRQNPGVNANFDVTELDLLPFADAVELMRYHAQQQNISAVTNASDDDLQELFDMVGGNPLALKLIVDMLRTLSLTDLQMQLLGPTGSVEAMFKRIFKQAWKTISPQARLVLSVMPLAAPQEGADMEQLKEWTELSPDQLWPAVQELQNRSLLQVRGDLHQKRLGLTQGA